MGEQQHWATCCCYNSQLKGPGTRTTASLSHHHRGQSYPAIDANHVKQRQLKRCNMKTHSWNQTDKNCITTEMHNWATGENRWIRQERQLVKVIEVSEKVYRKLSSVLYYLQLPCWFQQNRQRRNLQPIDSLSGHLVYKVLRKAWNNIKEVRSLMKTFW